MGYAGSFEGKHIFLVHGFYFFGVPLLGLESLELEGVGEDVLVAEGGGLDVDILGLLEAHEPVLLAEAIELLAD